MRSTRVGCHLRAPRSKVYRALLDPALISRWRVPDGMTCQVHTFEAREGGAFRVALTYVTPSQAGKTTAQTDTYHGRFLDLVEDERVVEVIEFETSDPQMRGEMKVTTTLVAADGGTELVAVHEGLPPGLRPEDNEIGWRMSLAKLSALVEVI